MAHHTVAVDGAVRAWLLAITLDLLTSTLITSPCNAPPLLQMARSLGRRPMAFPAYGLGRRVVTLGMVAVARLCIACDVVVIIVLGRGRVHGFVHTRPAAISIVIKGLAACRTVLAEYCLMS